MKISFRFAFLLIFNIIIFFIQDSKQQKSILIVLIYDGFQNSYLDRGITPTLSNFRRNGVTSEYMRTEYPALMVPSLHTIASGWGVRTHFHYTKAFTDDDPLLRANKTAANTKLYIWELNEKNKGKSICITWPVGLQATGGTACENMESKGAALKKRADAMITALNKTDEAAIPNLVMLYVEDLDKVTHFFGPLSRNSSLFIRRLDLLTKYIFNKLMEINIYHRANIFILSDHGVRAVIKHDNVEVKKADRKMEYDKEPGEGDDVADVNGYYEFTNKGINITCHTLMVQNFTLIGKKKNHFTIVRTPSGAGVNSTNSIIEFAACPGYVLSLEKWKADKWTAIETLNAPEDKNGPLGVHGYLRQNDAIFMAKGPSLARFKTVEPFKMEDLFCAFAKLLSIQGDYENDGNFSRIRPIFVESKPINWAIILVTIVGMAVIFCLIFGILMKYLLAHNN